MTAENRLREMGLSLPAAGAPKFTYVSFRRVDDLIFISGQVPKLADGTFLTGRLGQNCSIEQGQEAARLCGLHLLAVARSITGSLDDIEFCKLLGMVNAAPDFTGHGIVLEGCSQLLVEVMGERGHHARSAVGMSSLPGNVRVEVEAIVRIVE